MADIIQLLPDHVANQIAAGEVIQRPASVVKELLENAIDAKATSIKLLLKNAGKTLIQVIDNGIGMSQTDARLSFERHATSKIQSANDLFNLQTKGFRGEALASIAAIAQVELKTKQENQDVGAAIKIEGSEILAQNIVSTSKGTSIAVKNLFYNIPARRNFLKSDTVETRHIIDEFQRVALAHPDIAFSLIHNDNEIYHLQNENLRQRIVGIFGERINDKLVPIQESTDLVKITGFVTNPKYAKKKRGEQFFFANSRFIKSNYLNHAVQNAYDGLLAPKYFPSYFIYMKVDPSTIDINIHPTKTEVKFENESAIYSFIRATVKHSLGQYNVSPVLDFNRDENLDIPYNYSNTIKKSAPGITVNPNFNPFKTEGNSGSTNVTSTKKTENWESLYTEIEPESVNDIPVIIESNFEQTSLFPEEDVQNVSKTYQIQGKYIISSLKNSLLVIKQNPAHQRIIYEELLEKFATTEMLSQVLLIPIEMKFAKHDVAVLFENKADLEELGFQFQEFTGTGIILNAIPTLVKQEDVIPFFEEIIDNSKLEIPKKFPSQLDYFCRVLAANTAIKTGKILNSKEQEQIVDQLFSCKEPNYAPNGKKIYIHLPLEEIEKKFN